MYIFREEKSTCVVSFEDKAIAIPPLGSPLPQGEDIRLQAASGRLGSKKSPAGRRG